MKIIMPSILKSYLQVYTFHVNFESLSDKDWHNQRRGGMTVCIVCTEKNPTTFGVHTLRCIAWHRNIANNNKNKIKPKLHTV